MKSFKNYLQDSEVAAENPVVGDFIDFVINEELTIESSVIDVVDDGIIIELTDSELNLLESVEPMTRQMKHVNEDSRDAVRSAISRRIMSHHMDLLSRYGIDRVMDAIDDAADYYGSGDLDEIGTSDVSAFVNSVRQSLEGSDRVDELSPGRVERYAHAAQRDMARHSAAAKTLRHQRGAEDWQAQEHEREADRRERGLARAQRKMTEGAVKDIAIQYQDWKQMSPKEFFNAYRMTKDVWMAQNRDIVKTTESYELDEMRRRAGIAEGDITQLEKDIADAPVKPIASMEGSCGSMREVLDRLDGKRQQVAERMVDVDGFRFEMDYVIEELRAWFDHLDTGEDLDDTTAEHIEHALSTGRDHGRQLWAEMQDLPRRQFARVIGQIVNFASQAASEDYDEWERQQPQQPRITHRDNDDEGGISVDDLREGRMKQQMHSDAERMDLEAFCNKYGDESWVKEFWNNINELDEGAEDDFDYKGTWKKTNLFNKLKHHLAIDNTYDRAAAEFYDRRREERLKKYADMDKQREMTALQKNAGIAKSGEQDELDGNAYEMGYRAAALYSKGKNSNPFEYDDPRHDLWLDGWREGSTYEDGFFEAEYQGREVKLGKPMSGDTRKYKVYVKDPKTGNVKKVNFGDPNMQIRRDNPKARKSFRARHGCGTPRASDRTKAAYWSCRMWSSKPVSKILKGK